MFTLFHSIIIPILYLSTLSTEITQNSNRKSTFSEDHKLPNLQINLKTNHLTSPSGITNILHGVNVVKKEPPWYPDLIHFSTNDSLTSEDMANLKKWGINVVRLGIMWPGVNPIQDIFDDKYLNIIENIVNHLAEYGIYTILDCHQDLLSKYFCGEGAPDYIIKDLLEIGNQFEFPWPFINDLGKDKDGFPHYKLCQKTKFSNWYFAPVVGNAFVQLYTKGTKINKAFNEFWQTVAIKFKGNSNVVGYELLNEPFLGNFYKSPLDFYLHSGAAEKNYIQSFFEDVHNNIRKYDDSHIIFFDPSPFSWDWTGFTEGPGGKKYRNRQIYSYHVYCQTVNANGAPTSPELCHLFDSYQLNIRAKETKKYGCGGMLTEFGALDDSPASITEINYILDVLDANMHGFAYWEFKNLHDITTTNDHTAGFYGADGTLEREKVKALSRTYPMQTNGELIKYIYNAESAEFNLEYLYGGIEDVPTKVYFNSEMIYQTGIKVIINPLHTEYNIDYENGYLFIYHKNYMPKGTKITVKVSKQ